MENFKFTHPPISQTHMRDRKYCTVTQGFGQNLTPFYAKMGMKGHDGWDIRTKGIIRWMLDYRKKGGQEARESTKDQSKGKLYCYSVCAGTVVWAGKGGDGGIGVKVETDEVMVNGKLCKLVITYYHLSFVSKKHKAGDRVKAGYILGVCGNSGRFTTAAHLHLSVRAKWKNEGRYVMDTQNGYRGAIDPLPLMADGSIYVIKGKKYQYGKAI